MNTSNPSKRRWTILLALLAGAFWLAVFADKTPKDAVVFVTNRTDQSRSSPSTNKVTAPVEKAPPPAQMTVSSLRAGNSVALEALVPREQLILQDSRLTRRDLFAMGSWTPPPPSPEKPLPLPPPTAPPLPFVFVGKKLEEGVWEIYLARGDKSLILREGMVLESTYRVDKIEPPILSLTYLPLGQSQSLSIGESR